MAQLTQFLMSLSGDSSKLNKFKKNPNAIMDEAGLSDKQKSIILSKDSQKISSALASENSMTAHEAGITLSVTLTLSILG